MVEFLEKAKRATSILASLSGDVKSKVLSQMADALMDNCDLIISKNNLDISAAKLNNLSLAMIDRLYLDGDRVQAMCDSIKEIAKLRDPVGRILDGWVTPNGLNIQKVSIPIGLIAIIYESRPNVTSDTAALCFKSGNVCVLKGGKEAENSNQAIAKVLQDVLKKNNLPIEAISLIPDSSREGVKELIKQDKYVDLVIPRGGEALIRFVNENATVPVVKHDKGLCHTYIDANANANMAINIAINAKCQRPGVCNAMETLLVHKQIAPFILPALYEAFVEQGTELCGCEWTRKVIPVELADHKEYDTEYLANKLSIKVVKDIDEAIEHIAKYGSGHSEAIVSENYRSVELFLNSVDSACVYANASTRFTDGGEFGFGAEVGISTNKLHSRGPMGINDLTTYKYKVYGNGHIR
ncbi:MAG: glutamate-5-semialdehyde dehydrogenase [Arcobacter butzleri]|jgi:glutamate-5-semialdehyde dehydrogenase|nr:glutamate-5-semialdehyde dehydrogenase [Arcobacteraceae bacterium]MDY0365235.1 glutamate-5-semialdehyde dehydrogenase [Arcobacteraceae bacterium]NLO17652.1 glutamate-5-semialdehyde dehydrogenase [Aliarcobacter butzleri]